MNLHIDKEAFHDLTALTAAEIGIPETAVKRDYFIVMMLQKLENSAYADKCVFKGGTSLSKCYPGSIMRFSEDIDLTYIPDDETSKKQYDKALKGIEKVMSDEAFVQKIPEERNDRNKSSLPTASTRMFSAMWRRRSTPAICSGETEDCYLRSCAGTFYHLGLSRYSGGI